MPITMNDLTVNFHHLDRDMLLTDWHWLIGPTKLPILLSSLGNAFLEDTEDGTIHLLDAGMGEVYPIADTLDNFHAALSDREFVVNHFAVRLIAALRRVGRPLEPGQIYSFKTPPVLGGKYTLENTEATDIEIHFSVLGQLARQARKLAGADPIRGVAVVKPQRLATCPDFHQSR